MWCFVLVNDHYSIVKVRGFTPKGLIACLPDQETQEKYPFIIEENNRFHICPIKMSAWMKEQIKNGI